MFCSIYVIRNSKNDKVYVGQTWGSIQSRLRQHKKLNSDCSKLENAMIKYGRDNFSIHLLTFAHTQSVADFWEIYFIKKFNSIESGYNLKSGGATGKHSEETKRKISEMKLGIKFSEDHKLSLSKAKIGKSNKHLINNKIWLGKNHSEESRQKMSSNKKGRKLSEETKKRISESRKGQKPSEESKRKMSESAKQRNKGNHG